MLLDVNIITYIATSYHGLGCFKNNQYTPTHNSYCFSHSLP